MHPGRIAVLLIVMSLSLALADIVLAQSPQPHNSLGTATPVTRVKEAQVVGCPAAVAEALTPLGENLVRIWHFDNQTKAWSVYDPKVLVLSDIKVLVERNIYWFKVKQDETITLCRKKRSFTCSGAGTCWNLIAW